MSPATSPDDVFLVHAYVDGELDPAHAIELERRFATDPALSAERDRIAALRSLIGARLPHEGASAALAKRIEATIGARRASSRPSWQALAAAVLIAAATASLATWVALRPVPADAAVDMIVDSHIRALMAPQPTDVSSSDRHAVKPWFNGRTSHAPHVVDLTDKGFPLVGGRIDVLRLNPVATLVFRHGQHLISLTAVPVVAGAQRAAHQTVAGYTVVTWSDDGTVYYAVSDLGIGDLEAFAAAFRSAAAEP